MVLRSARNVLLVAQLAFATACGGGSGAASTTPERAQDSDEPASVDGVAAAGERGAPEPTSGEAPPADQAGPPPEEATAPPTGLAEWLNRVGVTAISQVDDTLLAGGGDDIDVQALAYADAAGAHVCVADDGGRPQCWDFPFQPRYIGTVNATYVGGARVVVTLGYEQGTYVRAIFEEGDLDATVESVDGAPSRPLEGVSAGVVPPLFAALRGQELVTHRAVVVARSGSSLRLCDRPEGGAFTCSESRQLDALDADGLRINSVATDFEGVVTVEYMWEEQDGDVYVLAQGVLYLRSTGATMSPLASIILAYERRSRASVDNDDIEVDAMEMYDIELRQATCVDIRPPTFTRRLVRADGGTRPLRPARARRAPNSVPATGVDPLSVNMAGAWAFEPQGGLRRIPRCDYADE
jgi:hypothetical protein